MKQFIILQVVILFTINIYCQNQIVDTLTFKNEKIFLLDSINGVDYSKIKNTDIFILPSSENDMDSSRYLFNNVLYGLNEDFCSKLDKKKKLQFITKTNEMQEYIKNNNLNDLIQDSVININKKLLIIIINE